MRRASEQLTVVAEATPIFCVETRRSLRDSVETRYLSTTCLQLANKVLRLLRAPPSWSCFVATCSELVAVALFFALALRGLHALAHVPVHERALRVHEVEFVVPM